jgi:hypothetical protein
MLEAIERAQRAFKVQHPGGVAERDFVIEFSMGRPVGEGFARLTGE